MLQRSATPTFWARAGALLQTEDYRRLLVSNTLLWHTVFMETVALSWLVLELTDSAWLVSLVGFCRTAPFLVGGFLAGPLADRWGRRPVLIVAQGVSVAAYAALVLLLWAGVLALWHLMATALILGAAWAFDWPARSALLPDLVGKARIVDATLLVNVTQNFARMAAPAIGGTLIALTGALGCYAAMTLLAALAWVNVRQLSPQPLADPTPSMAGAPSHSTAVSIGAAVRYVGRNQPLLAVILITVVINWLYFPYVNLLSVFARDVLNRGPVELGLLGAATGIGAFVGMVLISLARDRLSNGLIFTVGTVGMTLALLVFALSPSFALSWVMLLLAGVGEACFVIMQSSIILLAASDLMRTRVLGLMMLAIGSDPLGKLQTGYLAERIGTPWTVAAQAATALLCVLLVAIRLPGLRCEQAMQERG